MEEKTLLDEIREDYNNPKPKKVVKAPAKKSRVSWKVKLITVLVIIIALIIGVAIAIMKIADWGASHQFVKQPFVKQALELQFIYRIDEIEPEVIISPLAEKYGTEELTPIEKKIMDRWGFKDGVMALAIFNCGESGLDQYAVSHTGDLGIAQVNWAVWGDMVQEMGGTSARLLEDVDFNLDVAYRIWDRGDGEEGNNAGSWGDGKYSGWMGFNSGDYLRCLR